MQKEIKFRAWIRKVYQYSWRKNIEENVMRDVKSIELPCGRKNFDKIQLTVWSESGSPIIETYFEDADEFVIMQYTGLRDKNDKEIYEGDIVKCIDINSGAEFVAVVEFGNPNHLYSWGYQLRRISGDEPNLDILLWIDMEETGAFCEIIGNIYENLELFGGI